MKSASLVSNRAWRRTAAIAAVTSSVLLGGANAASAVTATDPACPFTRTVCLWDGVNYTGNRMTAFAFNAQTGTCVDLQAHGWGAGRTESARNTGSRVARLYGTTDCSGAFVQIVPGGTYGSIDYASNSVYVY
jgi:hypothetical protein